MSVDPLFLCPEDRSLEPRAPALQQHHVAPAIPHLAELLPPSHDAEAMAFMKRHAGGVLGEDPGLEGPDPGLLRRLQQRRHQPRADAAPRDRGVDVDADLHDAPVGAATGNLAQDCPGPVSYTHLTLPTIYSV